MMTHDETENRLPPAEERTCRQCGAHFLYTDAEREFRELRGLEGPTLCPECRERDRAFRNNELITFYKRTDTFDPFLFGENTQGAQHLKPHRATHIAICAQCGAETRVPFKPRDDRPVYCRTCFHARQGR